MLSDRPLVANSVQVIQPGRECEVRKGRESGKELPKKDLIHLTNIDPTVLSNYQTVTERKHLSGLCPQSNVQDELSMRLCMESNAGQRALLSLWGSGHGPEGSVPESSGDKADSLFTSAGSPECG